MPRWSAGVGDVTGSGIDADLVEMPGQGELRLLEVPPGTAGDPMLAEDFLTATVQASSGVYCGDVSGDGTTDLCTNVGIDRHPIDGVFDSSWPSTNGPMLAADLDNDAVNELYILHQNTLARVDGRGSGPVELAAPFPVMTWGHFAAGDWSGDGVDDLVLLGPDGLAQVSADASGELEATPILRRTDTRSVRGIALAALDPSRPGEHQLVLASPREIRVVDQDGVLRAHWSEPFWDSEMGDELLVSPGGLDGPDILIVVTQGWGTGAYAIYGLPTAPP